ncbi:MAG: polysaccharide biosynthesis tyrosine autokinase [Bacteroidia bacterium]|nr:polysaccharide biosynthesis tyrosine autokinase [Bacteroidia bacterium]
MKTNPSSYQSNNNLDIQALLSQLAKRWYYFAICIPLFLALGIFSIQTTAPTYKVQASMVIDPGKEDQILGSNQFMESGIQLFGNSQNILDEVAVFKSFNIVREPLRYLGFQVSYFEKEGFLDNELYKKSPFSVIPNETQEQIIETPITFRAISDQLYEVEIEAEDYRILMPDGTTRKVEGQELKVKQACQYGKECATEYFSFLLVKGDKGTDIESLKKREIYFMMHDLDKMTSKYINALSIAPAAEESSVLELSTEGTVIQKEVDFLNTLCKTYIQVKLDEKNQFAMGTIDFIDKQLDVVTDSLKGAEDQMTNIRQNQQTLDLNLTATNAVTRLQALETDKSNLSVRVNYYRDLLNDLEAEASIQTIVAPSNAGIADPLLNDLVLELKRLNNEKIARSLGGANSANIELKILNEQISNNMNTLRENVRSIIKSTDFALNDANRRIAEVQAVVSRLPRDERNLIKVTRKFTFNETLYNYLLQRRAEAGIAQAANVSDSKILDEARMAGTGPVAPNIPFILAGCIILGILIPTLIISTQGMFNTTITDQSQLERKLFTPVVGNIREGTVKYSKKLELENPSNAAVVESFRYLKVNLQYLAPDRSRKVISFTSTVPNEGKTFCAINLSYVLAMSGAKTIVLGIDMRKPMLDVNLGIPNHRGLSDYLTEQASLQAVIQPTGIPNLDAITSGPVPPNPGELLGLDQFRDLLDKLRGMYDYIILDTPPTGLVADFLAIAPHSDVNLYVVRMGASKWEFLKEIDNASSNKALKNLYVVINGVKKGPGNKKYGYYSSYYRPLDGKGKNTKPGSENGNTVIDKLKTLITAKS